MVRTRRVRHVPTRIAFRDGKHDILSHASCLNYKLGIRRRDSYKMHQSHASELFTPIRDPVTPCGVYIIATAGRQVQLNLLP